MKKNGTKNSESRTRIFNINCSVSRFASITVEIKYKYPTNESYNNLVYTLIIWEGTMLDGILGNARELDPKEVSSEIQPLLIPNEKIERAFKLVRDLYVFTDKRLILVDKQGMTGKKVEYHSIPYSKVTHFSVETAGRFDRDAELKLWVSGSDHPIAKEFKKGTDIIGVQQTLAYKILST